MGRIVLTPLSASLGAPLGSSAGTSIAAESPVRRRRSYASPADMPVFEPFLPFSPFSFDFLRFSPFFADFRPYGPNWGGHNFSPCMPRYGASGGHGRIGRPPCGLLALYGQVSGAVPGGVTGSNSVTGYVGPFRASRRPKNRFSAILSHLAPFSAVEPN